MDKLIARAQNIHRDSIILDSHIDIHLTYSKPDKHYGTNTPTQWNVKKMQEGMVDVAWLVVFSSQGSLDKEGYKKAYQIGVWFSLKIKVSR